MTRSDRCLRFAGLALHEERFASSPRGSGQLRAGWSRCALWVWTSLGLCAAACGRDVTMPDPAIGAGLSDAGSSDADTRPISDGGPRSGRCRLDRDGSPDRPPGVVITNVDTRAGRYVGSPSLVKLADGTLLASHDFFGAGQRDRPPTRVYRSQDQGKRWSMVATMEGQFWSTLFEHRGAVYLLGTSAEYGNLVIRRSTDTGDTWTVPTGPEVGLLRIGQFHTAPMPLLRHAGRLWRSVEVVSDTRSWGNFEAAIMSADAGADLLRADAWTVSLSQPFPADAARGGSWLEGNAVLGRDGGLRNILRVHVDNAPELAATLTYAEGRTPQVSFMPLPGGSKKFVIRYDAVSDRYLALANPAREGSTRTAYQRNKLALLWASSLDGWNLGPTLLEHPDQARHGFQYADWRFDGADLIFVSRTAYDDPFGGARSAHDANYMTFHRLHDFRRCLD